MTDPLPVASYPVTAYAAGNCLGLATREVLAGLAESRTGLKPCRWDLPFETFCGEVPASLERLPERWAAYDSRLARIALAALEPMSEALAKAVRRWGPERVAVVLGTSTGGILETEQAWAAHHANGQVPATYDFERQHSFHGLVELVKLRTGAKGPGYVVSTACSSSGKVLATGRRLIEAGLADAALVGGADSLCQTTLRGFHSLEVLSKRLCRPFCAERDGLNIGEGAAYLLLEREGEGPARLLGVGESCDAHHMSHPHPEGLGAEAAMALALAQAGVSAREVDHVNAHGTATQLNDAAEAKAIARLLGTEVPVVSTKGYTGHMLGAAGATEAVFAVAAIEHGWIPASLGAEPVDPQLTVQVNRSRRELRCRTVLSNSFAFGGNNVSVLFGASR
ncbi:MAG: beta-ketoacyl-ACP synthase [Deltaproteobacteria bacterium]|nr:beta-ketoacyl-ACP synthase [Deltaproteobacteria bacterium]